MEYFTEFKLSWLFSWQSLALPRWLGCLYLFFLPWPRSCWWLLHRFLCTAFTQTWANGRSYPLFSQGQPQSWRPTYWQWYWCSWASPWYQGSSLSLRQCFRSHVLLKSYFLALDPPTTIDAQCSRLDSRLGAARQEDLPYRIDQAILTDASIDWSCWGLKAPRSSPSTEARLIRVYKSKRIRKYSKLASKGWLKNGQTYCSSYNCVVYYTSYLIQSRIFSIYCLSWQLMSEKCLTP